MSKLIVILVLTGALLSVPTVATGGDPAERAAGFQKFLLLEVQTDNNDDGKETTATRVVARGEVHALGFSKRLGPRRDRFRFPRLGTLVIRHTPNQDSQHESFDNGTCYFTFRERGSWRVVRGTGDFADATGHGHYRVRGHGVACTTTQLFSSKVRATGVLRP
jgi:hypothetical protein